MGVVYNPCRPTDRHCNLRRNICSYSIAGDSATIHIEHTGTGVLTHTSISSGDGAAIHGEFRNAIVSLELHTIRLLIF